MPIYSYKCKTCGVQFDKLVSIKDADNVKAEECQSTLPCDIVRVPTAASVHFKGSGFYATDYKGKK